MDNTEFKKYMKHAIRLAKKGTGRTLPNPLVGALIVKDGRIIGEGYHENFGGLHAERNALANASEDVRGADMYVTLEPCAHHGKTPPCTEAIIESGIRRVFIGSQDPNPKVSGRGIKVLKDAGIEVYAGILKEECDEINRIFFRYITSGKPYLMMKYAMSADGKIATHTGDSKWISSDRSRELVHQMRNEYPAIMAGIGTVLKDDPRLTCRISDGTDPLRIICDSSLRLPLTSSLVATAGEVPVFAVCACRGYDNGILAKAVLIKEDRGNYVRRYGALVSYLPVVRADDTGSDISERIHKLSERGVGIINACGEDGKTDINELMRILGESGIAGVMLEGGGELNFSALKSGEVSEVNVFIGSKLIGGQAKTPVGGEGAEHMADAFRLKLAGCSIEGDDVWLKYYMQD